MVALLLVSNYAWALGLGDLTVRSYLGQPLDARIDLLSRAPSELEGISANLASADSFNLVGVDRMALSVPLNFVVNNEPGGAWIQVSSLDPVKDPVLQFVVEVNFANGRLLRQYTVFLDPPTVPAPAPLPSLTPRQDTRNTPALVDQPVVVEERQLQPEPQPESERAAPAASVEPSAGEPPATGSSDPADRPEEPADPSARASADPAPTEGLPETTPGSEPAETVDAPAAERSPGDASDDQAPERPLPVASSPVPSYQITPEDLETYGPVRPGQTLWGIATEVSGNSGHDLNQIMLAIQRVNPEAFGRGNINLLKRGSILRLPPVSEIERLAVRDAMLEAMRQADDYADIIAGRMPGPRPAPVVAEAAVLDAPTEAPTTSLSGEVAGRLELVPSEARDSGEEAEAAGSGDQAMGGDGLLDPELLSEEEIDNAVQESEHLTERIQELREELDIDDDSAVVGIEDKGLAEMEQALREQRTQEAPVTPQAMRDSPASPAGFSIYGGWLLLAAVVLIGGLAAWLFKRRQTAGEEEMVTADESQQPEDAPDPMGLEAEPDVSVSPVIELVNYIGHAEDDDGFDAEAPAGAGEEAEPDHEAEPEDKPDSKNGPGQPESESGPETEVTADGDEPETAAVGEAADAFEPEDAEDARDEPVDPETKLDLARAHIAMGDKDAARELLEEVILEGSDEQILEARDMMEEI